MKAKIADEMVNSWSNWFELSNLFISQNKFNEMMIVRVCTNMDVSMHHSFTTDYGHFLPRKLVGISTNYQYI